MSPTIFISPYAEVEVDWCCRAELIVAVVTVGFWIAGEVASCVDGNEVLPCADVDKMWLHYVLQAVPIDS